MSTREKLFSVTAEDLDWEFFRAGGNGGQKQNKTSSACRCKHAPSGAVGESREHRTQTANRRAAFGRMARSSEFQAWVRRTALGLPSIEAKVEEMMRDENLRIEYLGGADQPMEQVGR